MGKWKPTSDLATTRSRPPQLLSANCKQGRLTQASTIITTGAARNWSYKLCHHRLPRRSKLWPMMTRHRCRHLIDLKSLLQLPNTTYKRREEKEKEAVRFGWKTQLGKEKIKRNEMKQQLSIMRLVRYPTEVMIRILLETDHRLP